MGKSKIQLTEDILKEAYDLYIRTESTIDEVEKAYSVNYGYLRYQWNKRNWALKAKGQRKFKAQEAPKILKTLDTLKETEKEFKDPETGNITRIVPREGTLVANQIQAKVCQALVYMDREPRKAKEILSYILTLCEQSEKT